MNIDEDADLAERFAEIEPGQAFDHADEQSADQRARDRAHAAQHHDGERDQHEGIAGVRIDVIGRHQQAGGDRKARGAEPERHRVDVRDVDAAESSAPSFSLATARIALPVSVQRMMSQSASATAMTTPKAMTRGSGEEGRADFDHVEGVGQVDGARVGAEGVEQRVLDHDGKPERHQQDVAVLAMRRRAR